MFKNSGTSEIGVREVIWNLVQNYSDVFSMGDEPPGRLQGHPFRIRLKPNEEPIRSRPYKVPFSKEEGVRNELNKLLKEGIISPSASPWSSPIVLVRKKDGSTRMCIDFRRLNSKSMEDQFPLPNIEETLIKVRNSRFFSTLDMKSGYWQIPIAKEDREKTGFITSQSLYEWNYLPFGLRNALSHFSRVMNSILTGLIGHNV